MAVLTPQFRASNWGVYPRRASIPAASDAVPAALRVVIATLVIHFSWADDKKSGLAWNFGHSYVKIRSPTSTRETDRIGGTSKGSGV